MAKYIILPYIQQSTIGQIEVSIELTDEQLEEIKKMTNPEFDKFVKSNSTVTILDFDVEFDCGDFQDWEEN